MLLEVAREGPLTESMFYILVALHEPLHGYGIMQRVSGLSGGTVALGPGTLYGALTALNRKGYIRRGSEPEDGRGKKTYEITKLGEAAVEAEIDRVTTMIRAARSLLQKGDGHGSGGSGA